VSSATGGKSELIHARCDVASPIARMSGRRFIAHGKRRSRRSASLYSICFTALSQVSKDALRFLVPAHMAPSDRGMIDG
jgi:hypothetical protein